MPACFTLTKRGSTEPITFQILDEEICAALGKPVDPDKYCLSWYDIIGFRIALGQEWPQIVEAFLPASNQYDLQMLAICAYLQANYTANCWREW